MCNMAKEFGNFSNLTKRLLSVPNAEIDKRLTKENIRH
jgi:hypothetical protein